MQHLAENAGYSNHGDGAILGLCLSAQTQAGLYCRRSNANLDKWLPPEAGRSGGVAIVLTCSMSGGYDEPRAGGAVQDKMPERTPRPVLNPADPDSSRRSQCALAIMAKAPRPGKVKTRLCPPLLLDQSSALNVCFLKDTTENLAQITARRGDSSGLICYTPEGGEAFFDGIVPCAFGFVLQRGDGFGERLMFAAEDILACGFGAVCLIDSDSPTVPAAAFEQAVAELNRPGDRMVLGGTHDGGYYLIGLNHATAAPFQNIPWSTSAVYAETLAAAKNAGIEVVRLPLWYDVDDGAALTMLVSELLEQTPPPFAAIPGYRATATREFLRNLCLVKPGHQ